MKNFVLLHQINTLKPSTNSIKILKPVLINTLTIDTITPDTSYSLANKTISCPGYINLPEFDHSIGFCSLIERSTTKGKTEYLTVYETIDYINSMLNDS